MGGAVTIKGCEELLTPEEVAVLLKRPKKFVLYQLIATGALPASRVGLKYRIRPIDLSAYLEKRSTKAAHAGR